MLINVILRIVSFCWTQIAMSCHCLVPDTVIRNCLQMQKIWESMFQTMQLGHSGLRSGFQTFIMWPLWFLWHLISWKSINTAVSLACNWPIFKIITPKQILNHEGPFFTRVERFLVRSFSKPRIFGPLQISTPHFKLLYLRRLGGLGKLWRNEKILEGSRLREREKLRIAITREISIWDRIRIVQEHLWLRLTQAIILYTIALRELSWAQPFWWISLFQRWAYLTWNERNGLNLIKKLGHPLLIT